MKRVLRSESGMALAIAIFALVVIGALVAGAFFAGTQEQRLSENSRRAQQSLGVADMGAIRQISGWRPDIINSVPLYKASSFTVPDSMTPNRTGYFGGRIYHMNGNLFLIDITGRDRASYGGGLHNTGARQRVGVLTRIRPLQVSTAASLTTQGNVTLSGNAAVSGFDQAPAGWAGCDPPDTTKAGIRNNGSVSASGNAIVAGQPPVLHDSTVNNSTFTQFGDVTYDQLAAAATVQLPGGTYQTTPALNGDGTCNQTVLTNWGDGITPTNACGSYFPIVHISGDATLNGDQGQGILLVDGNLNVQGSYQYFGVVIVRGTLSTAGGGTSDAHFWGAVLAQDVDLTINTLRGNATLNYSKCAIVRALQMTGVPSQMRSRSWAQLF